MTLSSLNTNNGDQQQREDRQSMLESVRRLVAEWYPENKEFNSKLDSLFNQTRVSMIHKLLNNSCTPLGYIIVFFCANMVPDPSPPTNPSVCFG